MRLKLRTTPVLIVAAVVLIGGALGAIAVARGVLASEPNGSPTPVPLELPELPDKLQLQDKSQPQISPATSPPAVTRSEAAASQGQEEEVHTWEDGDRTLNVVLQEDLTVQNTADITPGVEVVARGATESIVRKQSGSTQDGLPVFRSQSGGGLMTLPGGILLSLDSEWDQAQIESFFSQNGISMAQVSELEFLPNGFLVKTEPGFPSLNLANSLAAQEGVEISSPNWWTQLEAK